MKPPTKWTLALALATLSLAAMAAPALGRTTTFRTPSGNIGCLYSSTAGPGAFLRCDVRNTGDFAFVLRRRGAGRKVRATDTVFDPAARVLRYGAVRDFGPFRCRSRRAGLGCRTRANGHGFFLSRQRQKTF